MSDDVTLQHNQRLQAIDPLVGAQAVLPEASGDSIELRSKGGQALAQFNRLDLTSFLAAFSAEENHQLVARVNSVSAMSDLLDQWDRLTRSRLTNNPDAEISLQWPSRDVAMTRLFKRHLFSPTVNVALRRSGTPLPPDSDDLTVRTIVRDDLEAACDRWEEVVDWDNQFLDHPKRSTNRERIREQLLAVMEDTAPWTWVAEQNGHIAGLLHLSKPADAQWIASATSVSPACYLMCLGVDPTVRGSGVGSALVRRAHQTLEAAQIPLTLLHYNSWNPLSGPFWNRMGYRPLTTYWTKLPSSLGPLSAA